MRASNPVSMGGPHYSVLIGLQNIQVGKVFDFIRKSFHLHQVSSLIKRNEVAIMYFGRTSEFLMVTSERVVIPDGGCTLAQLLRRLRKRGRRWADELDDSHLLCTVDGRDLYLFDMIESGNEICIASTKSVFEA